MKSRNRNQQNRITKYWKNTNLAKWYISWKWSSVIPPIGFILYFKYKKEFPNKAKKALGSGLIGVPIGFVMGKYVMLLLKNLLF